MKLETRAQIRQLRCLCRFARRNGDIDRRKCMLVQTKRLTGQALDPIAGHRSAEGARSYGQTQSRTGFMIGQNR